MSDLLTTRNIDSGYTRSVMTVDYEHHEIHSGSHFYFSHPNTLGSTATYSYLIKTPDTAKWLHMKARITGSAITTFEIFEGTARTGSTAATIFNSNRNSSTTSGATIYKGTAAGANGVLIFSMSSGSSSGASRSPSIEDRSNELILKQNEKYLLRVTSGTADNLTNVQLQWYEHTNA